MSDRLHAHDKEKARMIQKREERPDTDVSDLSSQKDGGYLLSLRTSTIGAIGLNFSVRNGKRWIPNAITT